MNKLQQADIEALIGDTLPPKTAGYFKSITLGYEEVLEKDTLSIDKLINTMSGGVEKLADWDGCWRNILNKFKSTSSPDSLIPGYFSMGNYYRYQGRFIKSTVPMFDYHIFTILRMYVFEKFFQNIIFAHEFGCGSGYNLYLLSQTIEDITYLFGYDYSAPAADTINEFHTIGLHATGKVFDMKNPDPQVLFSDNSGVFTIGALEQLGAVFTPFIEFLVARKAKVYVHMEPIYEFYDLQNSFDSTQAQVINNRGYLKGFLPYLESSDKIEIIKKQHVRFGSIVHEGWNIIAWKIKEEIL